jgi:hypothetical protein
LKNILLIILFVFVSIESFACTCQQPIDFSLEEYYYNDEVFFGKCISAEQDTVFNQLTNYIFEVLELYKGETKTFVKVQSANSGRMCGMVFIPGNRYLIFANKGKTSVCSSNFALDSDSLNFWNSKGRFHLTLKDTMAVFNGFELMQIINKTNKMKMEVLRKIANTSHGVVNSYFINGDLNSFLTMQDGKINGDAEFYHQDRTLKFKGSIINGKKEGLCEEYKLSYNKNNSGYVYIKEWGEYKNDSRVGVWQDEVLQEK